MATGLTHITTALQYLAVLAPGGTPNAGQQTQGVSLLNQLLSGWQAAGLLGWSKTTAISGKSQTVSVSTAGVVTQTEVGGTVTTVQTPVTVATFANPSTDNSYPSGWDEAIGYNLAIALAGPVGAPPAEWVVAKAAATLAAITPKPVQDPKIDTP